MQSALSALSSTYIAIHNVAAFAGFGANEMSGLVGAPEPSSHRHTSRDGWLLFHLPAFIIDIDHDTENSTHVPLA